jgi:hypothetical protein
MVPERQLELEHAFREALIDQGKEEDDRGCDSGSPSKNFRFHKLMA